MSPPTSLSACPPQIRAHPLPGDQCTDPRAVFHPPERRFHQLSAVVELPAFGIRSAGMGSVDFRYRSGAYALFRPVSDFHLGAGLDTDWASELTFMGRVGGSISNPLNMFGVSFTAMAGLRQVFDQQYLLGGGASSAVSGSLFAFGAELSWNIQLLQKFSVALPYFRFLATAPAEVDATGGRTSLPWSWQMQFGLGLSFDFLSAGN